MKHFSASELPLCFTEQDELVVNCELDLTIARCNQIYTSDTIKTSNSQPLHIHFGDVTAQMLKLAIEYLNDKLSNINLFLIHKYSHIVFDRQVFKAESFQNLPANKSMKLDAQEIAYLLRLTDMALTMRLTVGDKLASLLDDDQIPALPETKFSNIKPALTAALETIILQDSDFILSPKQRLVEESKHRT